MGYGTLEIQYHSGVGETSTLNHKASMTMRTPDGLLIRWASSAGTLLPWSQIVSVDGDMRDLMRWYRDVPA